MVHSMNLTALRISSNKLKNLMFITNDGKKIKNYIYARDGGEPCVRRIATQMSCTRRFTSESIEPWSSVPYRSEMAEIYRLRQSSRGWSSELYRKTRQCGLAAGSCLHRSGKL